MQTLIKSIYSYYRDIRHELHACPELCYEEYKTAMIVKRELEKLGLTVQTNVGRTGVVAILDSQKPGKTIALRADMDALLINEETQLSYSSKNPGKMHACGHDGHTATLLAVAHVLCAMKSSLTGIIKFIFQPAEEGGAGAKAMIDDGVLENPPVDVIFAYHNHPGAPLGTVLVKPGCTLYGDYSFDIHIIGKGGHAAKPETVINPITIAADLINTLQPYILEMEREATPSIIAISQINSGTVRNTISDTANIMGTIRVPSTDKFEKISHELLRVIELISKSWNAQIDIMFTTKYPPTMSSQRETEFVQSEATKLLGQDRVGIKPQPARASEDFSFYLQKVPGCYFFIGNGDSAFCHNAKYDFNDEVMLTAIELLCTLAVNYS